jgi:hypothetical protein
LRKRAATHIDDLVYDPLRFAPALSPETRPDDRGARVLRFLTLGGVKRSLLVEGYGIPLGRVLAGAHRHDSPLLVTTLDRFDDLGPLPEDITVHLDAGYDSSKTR